MSLEIALRRIEECKQTRATKLDLGGLGLENVPLEVIELQWLKTIDLSNNHLKTIPICVCKLMNLETLKIRHNKISSIPESIQELGNLITFDAWGNDVADLPNNIEKLSKLEKLDLGNNQFKRIPEVVGSLQNLRTLSLPYNFILEVSPSLTFLSKLEVLDIRENSEFISDVVEKIGHDIDPKVLVHYLIASQQNNLVPLSEFKVLILGEENVGKTTIVNRLLGKTISIGERIPTLGIIVQVMSLLVNTRNLTLHLWDFGGQEIMYSTHRFFLTPNSCYILVLDATKKIEENRIVQWLKTIHLYAPNASVIIVINKIDLSTMHLGQIKLFSYHSTIEWVETSSLTGEGFDKLLSILSSVLEKQQNLNTYIPAQWMAIKWKFSSLPKNYINHRSFQQICEEYDGGNESNSIANFLNNLGVIVNYSDDTTTKLTHIINPNWLTKAIYPIITNNEFKKRGGFVAEKDIEQVLNADEYPPETIPFILKVMLNHELCCEIKKGVYLFPDLLPIKLKRNRKNHDRTAGIVYQYDFLPFGFFSSLILLLQNEINAKFLWRNYIVLHQQKKPYANIHLENNFNIRITVFLSENDHRNLRTLLDVLRDKIESLHKKFSELSFKLMVPVNNGTTLVPYKNLLYLENKNQLEYFHPDVGMLNIRHLLEGHSRSKINPIVAPAKDLQLRQREQLEEIILSQFSTTKELINFLMYIGLESIIPYIHTESNLKQLSLSLIVTLEKAGFHHETGKKMQLMFLKALRKLCMGHGETLDFLDSWIATL